MNITPEYEAVVREMQGAMWKQKAWGTRVLRGDHACMGTLFTYIDNDLRAIGSTRLLGRYLCDQSGFLYRLSYLI